MSRETGLRMIISIAKQLLGGTAADPVRDPLAMFAFPVSEETPPDLPAIALAMYTSRRARERHFAPDLFGEAAWNILLYLYVQQTRNRRVSVTDACTASGSAPTTSMRWIAALCDEGLTRQTNAFGQRVKSLRLTPDGLRRIEAYLSEVWTTNAPNSPQHENEIVDRLSL